jgi:type I restriction enzyme S subunit
MIQKGKQLPESWKEVELGEACQEIGGGGTPTRTKPEYFNGDIPWVVVKDIKPIIENTSEYLTREGLRNSSAKLWKKGTVILSTGATIGRVGIAGVDLSTKQGVTALIPKNFLSNKYLYHYLKSITDTLKQNASGVTIREIYKRELRKIKIPFPSLQIQKQIVSILEKAESLKQKREESDKLTKEYLQSVFYEIFGNTIINEKKFEIKKLNEVCDIRDGTHASPKYVTEGYPLITSKNLTDDRIDFSEVNFISKKDFDEVNKRSKVGTGDILMPMIGTIGNPVIIPSNIQEFAIKNVALIKFTKTSVSNIYIKYILDSSYFDYITLRDNRGGTQKFIALGDIRNIPIPLPPLPLQQKFASIVEQVEKLKEKQKQSKEKIDEMFNSLMQKAFNGELVK